MMIIIPRHLKRVLRVALVRVIGGQFDVGGRFYWQCFDPTGRLKWATDSKNAVVTEGLNYLLDVGFHGATQISPWYIGLIHDTNYTGLSASDTLASHGGWEEGTEYTGDRPEWTEGAASGGVMTNGSTVDFSINASATMKGGFLCSVSTGSTGTLFCTALFSAGDQPVGSGDTLRATYTLTATSS